MAVDRKMSKMFNKNTNCRAQKNSSLESEVEKREYNNG